MVRKVLIPAVITIILFTAVVGAQTMFNDWNRDTGDEALVWATGEDCDLFTGRQTAKGETLLEPDSNLTKRQLTKVLYRFKQRLEEGRCTVNNTTTATTYDITQDLPRDTTTTVPSDTTTTTEATTTTTTPLTTTTLLEREWIPRLRLSLETSPINPECGGGTSYPYCLELLNPQDGHRVVVQLLASPPSGHYRTYWKWTPWYWSAYHTTPNAPAPTNGSHTTPPGHTRSANLANTFVAPSSD